MVLDAGHIVEFGTPGDLLKNEDGVLRSLVDESGDKETLYNMASNKASTSHWNWIESSMAVFLTFTHHSLSTHSRTSGLQFLGWITIHIFFLDTPVG